VENLRHKHSKIRAFSIKNSVTVARNFEISAKLSENLGLVSILSLAVYCLEETTVPLCQSRTAQAHTVLKQSSPQQSSCQWSMSQTAVYPMFWNPE